jgi:hypothetical protein
VEVLIDGQPPGANHGSDVDGQGKGTVTEQRLYQLVRQSGPIADRQFEIEFLDSGVEAFAFTFGRLVSDPQTPDISESVKRYPVISRSLIVTATP